VWIKARWCNRGRRRRPGRMWCNMFLRDRRIEKWIHLRARARRRTVSIQILRLRPVWFQEMGVSPFKHWPGELTIRRIPKSLETQPWITLSAKHGVAMATTMSNKRIHPHNKDLLFIFSPPSGGSLIDDISKRIPKHHFSCTITGTIISTTSLFLRLTGTISNCQSTYLSVRHILSTFNCHASLCVVSCSYSFSSQAINIIWRRKWGMECIFWGEIVYFKN
jgi:hypothetical protein